MIRHNRWRPLAFMFVITLVLPALITLLQFTSDSPGSSLWPFLNLSIPGCGLAIMVAAQWAYSRPLRQLRKKQLDRDPDSVALIVLPWDGKIGAADIVLLVADFHGLSFGGFNAPSATLRWDEVTDVRVIYTDAHWPELVEVTTSLGPYIQFVPMAPTGMYSIRSKRFPDCVTAIRRVRLAHSSHD